jgi:Caspase domain.
MISVISVGITDYKGGYNNIPCSAKDAKQVYSCFRDVLGDSFSDYSSICLTDIKSSEFISIVRSVSKTLCKKDKAIIYFSGHGVEVDNSLYLLFADATKEDNDEAGKYRINNLKDELKFKQGQYIIILDCCHSRFALSISHSDGPGTRESNISVIASTDYHGRAKYDDEGSLFTKLLCKTITLSHNKAEQISVCQIARSINQQLEEIDSESKQNCFVGFPEGTPDITLKASPEFDVKPADFSKVFLSKISCENRYIREAMWYSLCDMPLDTTLLVIKSFLEGAHSSCEADWLVRRAIGSTLSNFYKDNQRVQDLVKQMMLSHNWMLQTIGLIACRYSVNQELARSIENIIHKRDLPMSLVWLADLYFTDSRFANIDVSLSSNLAQTEWGLIQIWDRYKNKQTAESFLSIASEKIKNKKAVNALRNELFLRDSAVIDGADIDANIHNAADNSLVKILYQSPMRGRTVDKNKKWLYSILFGNWRGKLIVNLDEYFNNTVEDTINRELEEAKIIPCPQKRASVFSYLQYAPELVKKYSNALTWGLSDPHPWVRKDAVLAFKDNRDMVLSAFHDTFNRYLFIGTFDLIVSASRIIGKEYLFNYIDKYNLTPCEKDSIKHAVAME